MLSLVPTLVLVAVGAIASSGHEIYGAIGAGIIIYEMISWTAIAIGKRIILPALSVEAAADARSAAAQVALIRALVAVPPVLFVVLFLPRLSLVVLPVIIVAGVVYIAIRRNRHRAHE